MPKDRFNLIRLGVSDGRIRASRYFTLCNYIPQSDIPTQQKPFFLISRAGRRFSEDGGKHSPEPVARMRVEKCVFSRLNGRKAAEDQNAAVFVKNRRNIVFNGHGVN